MTTPSSPAAVRLAGYASLFDQKDLNGDRVRPGAFAASLLKGGARRTRMLFQHKTDEPIGVWDVIREDERGLYVLGRLLTDTPQGRTAAVLAQAQALDGLSIGFRLLRSREHADGRELLEIDLWEVSLVTFPMLEAARFRLVDMPLSQLQAAQGSDPGILTSVTTPYKELIL